MCFTSIQDFRDRATEQDLSDLEDFINAQTQKTRAFPNELYGFSYSSAVKFLKENGRLGGMKKKEPEENIVPEFIIHGGQKKECTPRTLSIRTDILERIDRLADDNWQYTKKAIINELLDEALVLYGY